MYYKSIFIITLGVILAQLTKAQGDLLITPIRVVFEGNKQKETLSLLNIGNDTNAYSISLINYHMKEDGGFEIASKPDSSENFADDLLRIFPRRVILAPGEPQVIMLQWIRKPNLMDGEYRSHLYFRADKTNAPTNRKNNSSDTAQMSVQLIPVYGISIPVIIRTGITHVKCSFSDIRIITNPDQSQILKFSINRTGNISVYGDIRIKFIPAKGNPYEIGFLKGVGVYTNIEKRSISLKLSDTFSNKLKNGKIHIAYSNGSDKGYTVYAEHELDIR